MSSSQPNSVMNRGNAPILEVDRLVMNYETLKNPVSAVADVSFSIDRGEAMGLVGESGCGKTSMALSLLRLAPDNARYESGEIRWHGADILSLSDEEMRRLRWAKIAMVFQGAMNAWTPVYRVGHQIREAIDAHTEPRPSVEVVRERIGQLLTLVGLDASIQNRYPHELSGGMRQRAVIAMALACDPELIIADEPTTALDVIVQAQILDELRLIRERLGLAILYISHDIAVIAQVTDTMGVMYAGKLVEFGPTTEVFARPRHPYTYLLLSSIPSVTGPRRRPVSLEGSPPDLTDPPSGCRFHPRCPWATDQCRTEDPVTVELGRSHSVACWNHEQVPDIAELLK